MSTATVSTTYTPSNSKVSRYALATARILLGLVFFVFGLIGLLHLGPQVGTGLPERAFAFATALAATGYMVPLVKATETVVGALLLSNRCVPFALVLLAPVMVNILAYHAFLAPSGMALPIVLAALQGVLAWTRRSTFRALFV